MKRILVTLPLALLIAACGDSPTGTVPEFVELRPAFSVTPGAVQPIAYVARRFSDNVSVIDVSTNTVTGTVAVGDLPIGVVITPDAGFAYVTNFVDNTLSVIEIASNTVTAAIPVGNGPNHPAVTPDGARIYVPNGGSDNVSVIDASSHTVVATVAVVNDPRNIAITPDGTRAYVTNSGTGGGEADPGIVSVIDTDPTSPSFHTVVATLEVGRLPDGIAIRPDGAFAYVRVFVGSYPTPDRIDVIDINPASPSFHTVVSSVTVPNGRGGMAMTPDGTELYSVSNSSNSVAVINTSNNTVTAILGGFPDPQRVAITPDGTRALVTNTFTGVKVIDTDPTSPAFHSVVATVSLGTGSAGVAITAPAQVITVDIDIKPGSDPNSINTRSKGVIPVAILGSATFNVSDVDVATLTFGPGGAIPAHVAGGHVEDVNDDGFDDLVSHYRTQDTGLSSGDEEACVDGATTGGTPIHGCDAVRIVR